MDVPQNIWKPCPSRLSLDDDEVHIWRISLEQPDDVRSAFFDTLTADERQKAERFRFEKDRRHFINSRGALRSILGRYLGIQPEYLRFSYNSYGKPALVDGTGVETLRFNVSHAAGLALYALTSKREIGIDVEFSREDFASMEIAERFFSPAEVEALRALSPDARTPAFFNCWTRKEAYIKALGKGLSHPLHSFTVSLAAEEPVALLITENDPGEASEWTLKELPVGDGYVAAVAVRGKECRFSYWIWDA